MEALVFKVIANSCKNRVKNPLKQQQTPCLINYLFKYYLLIALDIVGVYFRMLYCATDA